MTMSDAYDDSLTVSLLAPGGEAADEDDVEEKRRGKQRCCELQVASLLLPPLLLDLLLLLPSLPLPLWSPADTVWSNVVVRMRLRVLLMHAVLHVARAIMMDRTQRQGCSAIYRFAHPTRDYVTYVTCINNVDLLR
mmetsp:Transcript_12503/g.27028  ORF Transcript_12503/g.27028 Transcript_12503/m.27028 type:complete len:136 (-) Transcript_12503:43-450(-)